MALVIDLGPHALDSLALARSRLLHALESVQGVQAVALTPDPDTPIRTHVYLVTSPDADLTTVHRRARQRLHTLGSAGSTTLHIHPARI